MTRNQPSSRFREIKTIDTSKAVDARTCVSHLVDFVNGQLSPAEDFLKAWWTEEKKPRHEKSDIKQDILNQLKELYHQFEVEVQDKVSEFERKHGKDVRLEQCVYKMKRLMHEVTTNIVRFPTEDGPGSLGGIRFLTMTEFTNVKEKWEQSNRLYDYEMF
ncbi:hypothetical protein PISL3812_04359 [Talaromyces islandicus]|uniref:Uncharacterized protein n=1 Tax=Talaromyces islandicus TaxID=28573 RepID=A0A0U1LW79_TALIS|nr:hypothetical protein PISL3812_04359 [Talaromyces islandicus]